MDAMVVFLALAVTALVSDALAIFFGQDSRSVADDDWARPWSTDAATRTEC